LSSPQGRGRKWGIVLFVPNGPHARNHAEWPMEPGVTLFERNPIETVKVFQASTVYEEVSRHG
jgi:hypothetical protein